jgi:hypothetical protein
MATVVRMRSTIGRASAGPGVRWSTTNSRLPPEQQVGVAHRFADTVSELHRTSSPVVSVPDR